MRYNLLAPALNYVNFLGTRGEVSLHKLCYESMKRYCIILFCFQTLRNIFVSLDNGIRISSYIFACECHNPQPLPLAIIGLIPR